MAWVRKAKELNLDHLQIKIRTAKDPLWNSASGRENSIRQNQKWEGFARTWVEYFKREDKKFWTKSRRKRKSVLWIPKETGNS